MQIDCGRKRRRDTPIWVDCRVVVRLWRALAMQRKSPNRVRLHLTFGQAQVIAVDLEWRQLQFKVDNLRADYGKVNKEVAAKKKAKEDADDLIAKAKGIDADIKVSTLPCPLHSIGAPDRARIRMTLRDNQITSPHRTSRFSTIESFECTEPAVPRASVLGRRGGMC
jgi:hypothetical protein